MRRKEMVGDGIPSVPRAGQVLRLPAHSPTYSLSSGSTVVTLDSYPTIIEKQVSPFLQPCVLKDPSMHSVNTPKSLTVTRGKPKSYSVPNLISPWSPRLLLG